MIDDIIATFVFAFSAHGKVSVLNPHQVYSSTIFQHHLRCRGAMKGSEALLDAEFGRNSPLFFYIYIFNYSCTF